MSSNKKVDIGIYSGSFNPPGIHHKRIVERCLQRLRFIVVVPCGSKKRKDKVYPEDFLRKQMVNLGFKNIHRCYIDNTNLNHGMFLSNFDLEQRYTQIFGERVKWWHVVGSDLTCRESDGKSKIERIWKNGEYLWENSNFLVVPRDGYSLDHLPVHSEILEFAKTQGSSSKIKQELPEASGILKEVRKYILDNEIYEQER